MDVFVGYLKERKVWNQCSGTIKVGDDYPASLVLLDISNLGLGSSNITANAVT